MSLIDKLPEMSDVEVATLLDNARRLSDSGTPQQRAAAVELLPAVEEVAAARLAARQAAAAEKRGATKRKAPARARATAEAPA